MSTYEIKGLKFIVIDNSTYEIQPEQLAFFRAHSKSGKPFALMVHIPFYAPGRSVGFGCGHPDWGAKTDKNSELERRHRWRETHTKTTMDFYKEVFSSKDLLGVFAGHTHSQSIDIINGIPQFVTDDNASGAFFDISFLPRP
jgi:hypothetical protein